MSYVLAGLTNFNQGSKQITLKSRGRQISKAVDVAEIMRHRFMPELKIKSISIGTEEVESEGRKTRISTMEIEIAK
jgi:DNA-binding protein